jgi:hypothetical protein
MAVLCECTAGITPWVSADGRACLKVNSERRHVSSPAWFQAASPLSTSRCSPR